MGHRALGHGEGEPDELLGRHGQSQMVLLGDALVLTAYLAGALALTTLTVRRARVRTASRVKPELVL